MRLSGKFYTPLSCSAVRSADYLPESSGTIPDQCMSKDSSEPSDIRHYHTETPVTVKIIKSI